MTFTFKVILAVLPQNSWKFDVIICKGFELESPNFTKYASGTSGSFDYFNSCLKETPFKVALVYWSRLAKGCYTSQIWFCFPWMQPHPVISKSSIWFRLPLFKICRNITTHDWRRPIVIVYWSTNMFCLKPQWFPVSERKITTLLLIAVYDTRGEAFIHRTTPFISKLFPTRSYLGYHILYHSMYFYLIIQCDPKESGQSITFIGINHHVAGTTNQWL